MQLKHNPLNRFECINSSFQTFRVELSEGQGFVFPLKSRRQQGTIGTDRLIFPKTQLTNMMRIVIVAIDGVFMAGFSEVQVIGCKDTIHVSIDDNQDIIQVC